MKKITVSAPGKIMLMGEHAVVYGYPCIVTAVSERMTVTLEESDEMILPPGDTRFIEIILEMMQVSMMKISTNGFSSGYGLGSSSAITVSLVKALSEYIGKKLNKKQIFDIAYKAVLKVQGKGSGFDVAAAIWGGTLYFVTGGKVIEPLHIKEMPLVVGYTGVKADTVSLIQNVAEKMEKESEKMQRIYDAIGKLVDDAKIQMLVGDWGRVGKFMNYNQEYLRDLGVSTPLLEQLISSSISAGAYGAKLSGAGGGDCMITLGDNNDIKKAIQDAGGAVLDIKTNAEGVRVE